ncbi:MAG: hypothetical protein ACXVHB_23340 [Solirubrobacteraceae bacterium]
MSKRLFRLGSGHRACVACGGNFIYAPDRRELGDGWCSLNVRCRACQHQREVPMTPRMVTRFDRDVDRGRSAIVHALGLVDLERMTHEAEAFARALERDLIDTGDFGG